MTPALRRGRNIVSRVFKRLPQQSARPRPLRFECLEGRQMMAGDPVLFWNDVALDAVAADASFAKPDQGGPTATSRALGIVHAAIYDAVNSIFRTNAPYLYTGVSPAISNVDAAVAAAAHQTLVSLYPKQRLQIDAIYKSTLAAIPDGLSESFGVNAGIQAANRILPTRWSDGSATMKMHMPVPGPGHHREDPLHPMQGYLTPDWGKVKPFTLLSGAQFRLPAPPALNSAAYAAAYNQVKVVGAKDAETADRDHNGLPDRTPEQTEIGIFWAYDGTPGLGTPPRMLNQITRVIAEQKGNTVVQNARLFALVNLALADAGISAWDSKYAYDFWRPVLAIRTDGTAPSPGGLDGNLATAGEANWQPLGAPASNTNDPQGDFTPPFPSYASGHATFGAAAFKTIANFYGTDDISFTFTSDELNGVTKGSDGVTRPLAPRSFDSLSEATYEDAISRIYLGIHWIFDATEGIKQGTQVADWVFTHALRPVSGPAPTVFSAAAFQADVNQFFAAGGNNPAAPAAAIAPTIRVKAPVAPIQPSIQVQILQPALVIASSQQIITARTIATAAQVDQFFATLTAFNSLLPTLTMTVKK